MPVLFLGVALVGLGLYRGHVAATRHDTSTGDRGSE